MRNFRAHLAARAAAALPARRMITVHVAMASQHKEYQHIHKHSKHRQHKHRCDSIVNDSALRQPDAESSCQLNASVEQVNCRTSSQGTDCAENSMYTGPMQE